MPEALESVKKHALDRLCANLATLFNEADDWLFEQIDSCSDGRMQQEYLDMMRMVRLQRAAIEKKFLAFVSQGFRSLSNPSTQKAKPVKADTSISHLSLVGHDEMEQKVALESMASRARRDSEFTLKMLEARLSAVLPEGKVTQDNNPLDPSQLCVALSRSIDDSAWDIKHQLIFFKLFQRYVLHPHKHVLEDCNNLLIQAGVLQGLSDLDVLQSVHLPKSAIPAKSAAVDSSAQVESQLAQDQSQTTGAIHHDNGSRDIAAVLSGALASLQRPNVFNLPQGSIGSTASGASELALSDVVALLGQLQQSAGYQQNGGLLRPQQLVSELTQLIEQRPQKTGPEKVADVDANIINLVAMLFDYVLSDEKLVQRVKAVITRLQIPYVRLAVLDPQFLSSGKHPARQLINELASAGCKLNEQDDSAKDVVYDKIEAVVQKILDDFVDDQSIFHELLKDFREFIQREEKRAQMVSQRIAALEEGKLRADQAKQDVSEAIANIVGQQPIPQVMANLLDQPWYTYLCWIHHNKGKDSPEWVKALYIVQQMLFCLQQVEDDTEQENRQAVIEEVTQALEQGCALIAANDSTYKEWLEELASIFQSYAVIPKLEDLQSLDKELDRLLGEEPESEPAADSENEGLNEPVSSRVDEKVTVLDITKKAPAIEKPDLEPLDQNDPGMQQALKLTVGAWLEYQSEDQKLRCKLAAHIKSVDKMIFANRSGAKLFEKSLLEVAHEFNEGRFSLLDDSLLFDRALESVISGLRDIRERAI